MIQFHKKPANRLINAYNQMMEVMQNAFEKSGPSDLSLQKALNLAKQQAAQSGQISTEEAHEISEYIKRDINDAAEYMMDAKAEFYEWLMLDIEIIERKVMELFLSVASHTRIELEQLKHNNLRTGKKKPEQPDTDRVHVYKSGEITGPGTLICECCGANKAFLSSNEITDCEHCGHFRFIRRWHN
jgi:hypothetical protein